MNNLMRNDTAKRYREIHRILLKGNDPIEEWKITREVLKMKDRILLGVLILAGILVFVVLFAGCAHAQELTASWYSVESLKKEGTWAYSHGRMANGKIFKDENLTCATRLWKIGTILRITSLSSKKSVSVKVTDRIGKRFANKRIDLSKKAFKEIANLNQGIIKVKVEVL